MINCLKKWSFDTDLKVFNIKKKQQHLTNSISEQQLQKLSKDENKDFQQNNCNYEMLLKSAEREIAFEWKNQQQKDIVPMIGRIIISDQSYVENQLLFLGHLLLKLEFLHQKFDVILSGKCKPVFLKQQHIPISINLIEHIFHCLNGKCNQELIPVDLNEKQQNYFLIVLTENKFTISNQCKEELISDGIQTIYILEQGKGYSLEVQSGEINEVSSLLEILGEISQNKKKEDKSKIKQNINTKEILNLNVQDLSYSNIKEVNNLKSLLEISKYTKYSLSSKGTTIDIKGIIKFFCTNGTAKDIMKKKNKGGKSLYVFQVVLDLKSYFGTCLIKIIIPFLYKLIEFCKECKIVCNLHIYCDPIIIVKQNFSTIWTQQEQEQLLNYIANFNDDIQIEYTCNQLRIASDHLSKFNSYKKYLIFINHQLYNYSYQDLSIFINLMQQQQIKLVSIGVDINKQTNSQIEGITHFPLLESNDLYKIMKDLVEKKIQQDLEIEKFEFKIDNQRFPNQLQLQLQSFQSDSQNINQYLNRYFNYVSNTDQKHTNEISQNMQMQTFNYELIQNKSNTQINECQVIAINKDCSIIVAGCLDKIIVFQFIQEELKETQVLSQNGGQVITLNFMKQSNHLISGSMDKQIIIWRMNINKQWVCQQKLIEHSDQIRCLVLNNNDDMIISGSDDKTIKFWNKKIQWFCQQTIQDHIGSVLDLSINQQQNKVISCGEEGQILIIEYSKQNSKWVIIQKITEELSSRICFIDNDLFSLQNCYGMFINIYEKNNTNQLFEKTNQMVNFNLFLLLLLSSVKQLFPLQYIKSKGLLVNQIGDKLLFLRRDQYGEFQNEQHIEFESFRYVGKLSDDGQYIFTWEEGENEIQIRKYHEI